MALYGKITKSFESIRTFVATVLGTEYKHGKEVKNILQLVLTFTRIRDVGPHYTSCIGSFSQIARDGFFIRSVAVLRVLCTQQAGIVVHFVCFCNNYGIFSTTWVSTAQCYKLKILHLLSFLLDSVVFQSQEFQSTMIRKHFGLKCDVIHVNNDFLKKSVFILLPLRML